MRDYLMGAVIGFAIVTGVSVQAQAPAATCTLNFADGATLSGLRQLVASIDIASGVSRLAVSVNGDPLVGLLSVVSGSDTPQAVATRIVTTGLLDTTAYPDGPLTLTVTAYSGSTQIAQLVRTVTVKNAPTVAPPPPVDTSRAVSLSFGFRGNGAAKLVDVAPTESASLEAVTIFSDVTATIRLIQGTGAFCGTNRANLTRAYPVLPNQTITLIPPGALHGQAICVYFTPAVAGGTALVQGDLRGTIR